MSQTNSHTSMVHYCNCVVYQNLSFAFGLCGTFIASFVELLWATYPLKVSSQEGVVIVSVFKQCLHFVAHHGKKRRDIKIPTL